MAQDSGYMGPDTVSGSGHREQAKETKAGLSTSRRLTQGPQ